MASEKVEKFRSEEVVTVSEKEARREALGEKVKVCVREIYKAVSSTCSRIM